MFEYHRLAVSFWIGDMLVTLDHESTFVSSSTFGFFFYLPLILLNRLSLRSSNLLLNLLNNSFRLAKLYGVLCLLVLLGCRQSLSKFFNDPVVAEVILAQDFLFKLLFCFSKESRVLEKTLLGCLTHYFCYLAPVEL